MTGPNDDRFTFGEDTLMRRMGMRMLEISAERVVASMPVAGNTQPYGLLHGGATAALAETIGSYGAAMHAGPDQIAVGVDLSITHHRAVADGIVTGAASALHLGRTIAAYEIAVTDESGKRVATARLTCAIRPRSATLPKHV
jgi:uncharacterized protein (TIGR00369 family)